jgi:hypothetical protein
MLVVTLTGHEDRVAALTFGTCGQQLASGSRSKIATIAL